MRDNNCCVQATRPFHFRALLLPETTVQGAQDRALEQHVLWGIGVPAVRHCLSPALAFQVVFMRCVRVRA